MSELAINLPFKEEIMGGNTFIREFKQSTDSGEYYWHRDHEDRVVISTEPTDWMIQIDNELPKSLNGKVFIPMGVWHRLIKGSGDLKINLVKIKN